MKKKGFTLIELMIVVAIIAVIAAIAIPNLIASKIASNEATAVASLKAISNAQFVFKKTDYYDGGDFIYANEGDHADYDGDFGIADLFEIGYDGGVPAATAHKILDKTVALADSSCTSTAPKGGYIMSDLTGYDYSLEFGAAAIPSAYNTTGRNVFIIDVTGTIYQLDASSTKYTYGLAGTVVTAPDDYPDDTELTDWIAAGQ